MMKKDTETVDYPQDNVATEAIHCSNCGYILTKYSPASHADLALNCPRCKQSFSVTLREDTAFLKSFKGKKKSGSRETVTAPV